MQQSAFSVTAELLLIFVFSVLTKRLSGKNISKMTYFVSRGCKTLINQSFPPDVSFSLEHTIGDVAWPSMHKKCFLMLNFFCALICCEHFYSSTPEPSFSMGQVCYILTLNFNRKHPIFFMTAPSDRETWACKNKM